MIRSTAVSFSTSSLHSNPPAYSHISSSFAPQGHALPVAGGLSCQWQERRFRGLVSPSAPMPRAAFWPNGAHLHLAWPGLWQWPSRSVAGRQRECRQAASGRWPDHGRPLFLSPEGPPGPPDRASRAREDPATSKLRHLTGQGDLPASSSLSPAEGAGLCRVGLF